jgi:hypothetical protein
MLGGIGKGVAASANYQPERATSVTGCGWLGGLGTEQESFTSDRHRAPMSGVKVSVKVYSTRLRRTAE